MNYEESFYDSWKNTVVSEWTGEYSSALCEMIIRSHRLIGATCVGLARRNIGLERIEFDLVIIDEAGKALPAEMLIPLLRAQKAVIIGDQRQLPPVINPILYDEEKIDLEERAVSENDLFCHSFFERLYDNAPASNKIMLDTQYRMPSIIGTAISKLFYNGELKNGRGTDARNPVLFNSNLTFIDFEGERDYHERKDAWKNVTNDLEAKAAVALVKKIRGKDKNCKIAVITPYKGQKRCISNCFFKFGMRYQMDNIYVDTIDSFQGSEADVVIFCTTRSLRPTLFFKDTRRLNVALSRTQRELIILGKLNYFYKYERSESCLPSLADYIKKHGNILRAQQCTELHEIEGHNPVEEIILLPMNDILLPDSYYVYNEDFSKVQEKEDEYYTNEDFLEPMQVRRTKKGYVLENGFEQFHAALELNIQECACIVNR